MSEAERTQMRRKYLGFVYQFHHLLPEFSALENVVVPQMIAGLSRKQARERGRQLLSLVGLTARETHRPARLSGGEQQRVAIAKILAQEPAIVLADEPVASLDLSNGRLVMQTLRRVASAAEITVVATLHHVAYARSYADRILGLKAGRVVFDGPASRLTDAALFEIFGEFEPEPALDGGERIDALAAP